MEKLLRRCFFSYALLPVASSLKAEEPVVSNRLSSFLSDEEEIRLGQKVSSKIRKEAPPLPSQFILTYLNDLANELGSKSQRHAIRYSVAILNSPLINANATYGGFVHVYRGLLDFVKDESELVGVLSHEIGHVVGRHAVQWLARDAQISSIVKVAKATIGLSDTVLSEMADLLVDATTLLPLLQLSREAELEADCLGLYQMRRIGYNPDGLLSVLTRMSAEDVDPNLVQRLLSTHPAPLERQAAIRSELRLMSKREYSSRPSSHFVEMKEILAGMPPALPAGALR